MKILISLLLLAIPTCGVLIQDTFAYQITSPDYLKTETAQFEKSMHYDQAITLVETTLAGYKERLDPQDPDIVKVSQYLSRLYRIVGRYDAAEKQAEYSLEILRQIGAEDDPAMIGALDTLAEVYLVNGHHAKAGEPLTSALKIAERIYGQNHPVVANVRKNLARYYRKTNKLIDAEREAREALEQLESLYGLENEDVFRALDVLAEIELTIGKIAEAEKLFILALVAGEKSLGTHHPDYATCTKNYARLYFRTGRYLEAEPLFWQALKIFEENFGTDNLEVAARYNNLGRLNVVLHKYSDAEKYFNIALKSAEKKLGDHHETAARLQNLAGLYHILLRDAEAESYYKRALDIDKKINGNEHPNVARDMQNLAALYFDQDKLGLSEKLYKKALHIALISGEPELLKNTLHGYSKLLNKQSNPEAAIFLAKQAVNVLQELRQNISGLGKNTLKTFTESIEENYKYLATLLIEQGRLAEAQQVLAMLKEEEYFEYIRRDSSTAPKLDTKAGFITPEIPWDLEYKKILKESLETGNELLKLRKGTLSTAEKKRLKELETLSRQQETAFNDFFTRMLTGLKEDIRRQAKASGGAVFSANQEITTTLQKALRSLGSGAVLLQYVISNAKVSIILTTPDRQVEKSSLIMAADLNTKLFAFRDLLKQPNQDPRSVGKELHDILIAPIEQELKQSKAQTLMLSLEGALRYVPFAALFDGSAYVAEKYRTVMYAEAARQTITMPVRPDWTVAALGVSKKVHPDFCNLPSVSAELAGIVKNNGIGALVGEAYLDKDFTELRLLDVSGRNPVLHIASHFKFSTGVEKDSFLLLGDGTTYSLEKVRSGKAFSTTELLTLSACETALGTAGTGREIEGFGALAMNSGTKAVIASLWSIADNSTALLMQQFYTLREDQKLSKVEALRQAQLVLLNPPRSQGVGLGDGGKIRGGINLGNIDAKGNQYVVDPDKPFAHPFYWAPFILMGNWK